MTGPIFLIALAILGTTLVLIAGVIAGALRGRGAARSELDRLSAQLDQQAAALEDSQHNLANQSAQLAELQERVDFAERLLAQGPDRTALKRGPRDE